MLEILEAKSYYSERSYIKAFANDSLLINEDKIIFRETVPELREWTVNTEKLAVNEAKEIFGNEGEDNYFPSSGETKWINKDFIGIKVKILDEAVKQEQKDVFESLNVLGFSEVIMRKDKKYALIQLANNHQGQILHIYKNTKQGWILYKAIQLLLI